MFDIWYRHLQANYVFWMRADMRKFRIIVLCGFKCSLLMFVAKIPLSFFTSRLSVIVCHLDLRSEGARGTRFGDSNAERVARNDELLEAIQRAHLLSPM